ncbi:hypothetical protein TNCV_1760361 [Trichonephila clavipes]|nr:hypothetical protein TNCV_1760361 [Trichonephila clavipes]
MWIEALSTAHIEHKNDLEIVALPPLDRVKTEGNLSDDYPRHFKISNLLHPHKLIKRSVAALILGKFQWHINQVCGSQLVSFPTASFIDAFRNKSSIPKIDLFIDGGSMTLMGRFVGFVFGSTVESRKLGTRYSGSLDITHPHSCKSKTPQLSSLGAFGYLTFFFITLCLHKLFFCGVSEQGSVEGVLRSYPITAFSHLYMSVQPRLFDFLILICVVGAAETPVSSPMRLRPANWINSTASDSRPVTF